MSAKGKRVQIYIPADLVKKWDEFPRYERSAEVAKALRARWEASEKQEKSGEKVPNDHRECTGRAEFN